MFGEPGRDILQRHRAQPIDELFWRHAGDRLEIALVALAQVTLLALQLGDELLSRELPAPRRQRPALSLA